MIDSFKFTDTTIPLAPIDSKQTDCIRLLKKRENEPICSTKMPGRHISFPGLFLSFRNICA
jgi:hypothetical protein